MIDHEIQDGLRADPSPEFLARVRTRIANEPAPSAWRWSWTIAAACTFAAAIVIAVAVSRPQPAREDVAQVRRPEIAALTPRDTPEPRATRQPAAPTPSRVAPSSSGVAQASRPAIAAPGVSGSSRTRTEPEVLIDPAETRALQRLIAGVRDGRIDLAALANASTPGVMELPAIQEIAIPAITIDPLTPSGEQGARQ